ncbi:MAG TPA: patatin-like phospholipase family protein [Microvirga sp.]|jgi:predicted acylesterase/phospholipase RssA|nr:patatin-like phospholipase family protein [Microvirga sp.]
MTSLPAVAGSVGENQRSEERAPFTVAESVAAQAPRVRDGRFYADSLDEYRKALANAAKSGEEPWLVLSGGGENGAYGAGLLNGWTAAGNRPRFSVVSGISTGALIAPLAFAGPKFDRALEEAYTGITAADIFEFGGTGQSLVDTWPLQKLIERFVNADLLKAVAAEHKAGRRLFVVTTNVDVQRPVAWNMGAIAAEGSPDSLKLFRNILMASSAIPGIFPPVELEVEAGGKRFKEMHADGGITAPFFVAPEAVIAGRAGATSLTSQPIYVVVNNQLNPEFQVTERTMLSILGRSMSMAVKAASRAAMAVHASFAQRSGHQMAFTHIDERFKQMTTKPFDPDYMKALFEHGRRVGQDGTAFRANPFETPSLKTAERR